MPLTYDPEFATVAGPVLEVMKTVPPAKVHDVEARRTRLVAAFGPTLNAMPEPPVDTQEHQIRSFDGTEIVVYHYRKQGPVSATPEPALLRIHGGGMIAGSAKFFGKISGMLAVSTEIPVFDVEYRLAPEYPDPVPVEDCFAALTWMQTHAGELNIDPARIAVYGESAGGGLAAGVALLARDRELQPPLAKQILVYPMLDCRNLQPVPALAPFLVWDTDSNITGWTALLGDRLSTDKVSPYASPALATSVEGLAPAYIDLGTLDLFRDEDLVYAHRLAAANVDVELHTYPGVPHAFELLAPGIYLAKQAVANRLRAIANI